MFVRACMYVFVNVCALLSFLQMKNINNRDTFALI